MSIKYCKLLALTCLTVALLVMSVTGSSSRVERKALWPVVRKLLKKVYLSQPTGNLTAPLKSFNAVINALMSKAASPSKTVAFQASTTSTSVNVPGRGIIILGRVTTNLGDAYDEKTGIFTAPVSGLYSFQSSIMSAGAGGTRNVVAAIVVDVSTVAIAASDQAGRWDQSTMNAIVHVDAGQKVFLRNVLQQPSEFYQHGYTAFSGFLIKAD